MDKRVEIHGTSRADMNGKRGIATDFHWYEDKSKFRYTVQLDSGEAFKLKSANVWAEGLVQIAPLLDQRVEIHGTNQADVDGLRGVAIDFRPSEEKYLVKFDTSNEVKLAPAEHVRAEGTGGGAGGGKAKGKKGKKGRGS